MDLNPSSEVQCPHCGEWMTIFVDLSAGDTSYIEDCQVCCRPMLVNVSVDDLESGEFQVYTEAG